MKLPNGFKLIIVPPDSKHLWINGEFKQGVCNYYDEIIYLANNIGKGKHLRQSIIHELTHSVIQSNIPNHIVEGDNDEWIADFVGMYADEIVRNADYAIRHIDYMKERGKK